MDNKELAKKLKGVLNHLEKIFLALALAALATFTALNYLNLGKQTKGLEAERPIGKKEIPVNGDPVAEYDLGPYYNALDGLTNPVRTPMLSTGHAPNSHLIFNPTRWMSNQGYGLFRTDDGDRKMGIRALRVVRPPYYTNFIMVRPEVVLSGPGQPPREHALSLRAQHIRYQTTNAVLFSNHLLHSFLPTTNIVLRTTNDFKHTLMNAASFLDLQAVANARLTNQVRWDEFRVRLPRLLPALNNEVLAVRHPRLAPGTRLQAHAAEPWAHPEQIITRYREYTNANNAHWCGYDFFLGGQTNAIRFRNAPWVQAHVLQEREDPALSRDQGFTTIYWEQFVDLAYVTPNKQVYFPACRPGRKFCLDGNYYVLERIMDDHLIFGMDLDLTPETDSGRHLKERVDFPVNVTARSP